MSKKKRTILFILFVIIFFILSPYLILYATGYVFDFHKGKFTKTGAFYFKTNQTKYETFINGKIRGKPSIVFGTIFIKNVIPGEYNVEIFKEGFYPWKKNLQVKEGLTTEARHIFLFPKNINFIPFLSQNIEKFYLNWENIFFIKRVKNEWILKKISLNNKEEKTIISNENIEGDCSISKIIFSSDEKTIILECKNDSQKRFFLVKDIDNKKIIFPLLLPENCKEISFSPTDNDFIFFIKDRTLFQKSLSDNKLKEILTSVVSYSFWKGKIIWLDNNGFLYESDLTGKPLAVLNFYPFPVKNEKEYKIYLGNNLSKILLKEDDTLFYLDHGDFKKISDGVKKIEMSPDVKKVALYSEHEIKIFFWEDLLDQPQRKKGEIILLFRFLENIGKVKWINGDYIIFSLGNKIKISEIDNRDHINVIDIGTFENPSFEYDGNLKKIFLLSKGTLYISSPLFK